MAARDEAPFLFHPVDEMPGYVHVFGTVGT